MLNYQRVTCIVHHVLKRIIASFLDHLPCIPEYGTFQLPRLPVNIDPLGILTKMHEFWTNLIVDWLVD